MQEFIGSVRRSFVFKPSGEESAGLGGFVEKLGSSIRKSRMGYFTKAPLISTSPLRKVAVDDDSLPPMEVDESPVMLQSRVMMKEEVLVKKDEVAKLPVIRWRKGEMIGCGAFGRVYMGMNLDSGELIAVKEVSSYLVAFVLGNLCIIC